MLRDPAQDTRTRWLGKGRGSMPTYPLPLLNKDNEQSLRALAEADSITADPHKTGLIPLPASNSMSLVRGCL